MQRQKAGCLTGTLKWRALFSGSARSFGNSPSSLWKDVYAPYGIALFACMFLGSWYLS